MPTKTDRILGYLPGTFRPQAARSALRAVVDAFGSELQHGENLLAQVMQSHWVDFADRGATEVDDLGQMSPLYGLLPRPDESVEQFRIHLKRYVRTLLDGTVTVQGVLRIAAEALGLEIDDGIEKLDTWWRRPDDAVTTVLADAADAAEMLFGVAGFDESGTAARRAEIVGTPDLAASVDLRDRNLLYVVVDAGATVVVDLATGAADPGAVSLEHILTRLTDTLGPGIARSDGHRLSLSSNTFGPDSRLEVREGPDDAATAVLGLLPLTYRGHSATSATIVGTGDHAAGVDLTGARYLRLVVDHTHLAEIDCADADPAHTFLDHIRDAINTGLGVTVASHDGHRLTLTSLTTGAASSIEIQPAAAEDAAELLLGVGSSVHNGTDPQPASYTGTVDLRDGVDLSENSQLRVHVDDEPTVTVDCAGAVPQHTALTEIVAAINQAISAPVAAAVGGRLQLTSPSSGQLAELLLVPVSADAAPALLGLPPRLAEGSAATVAHFEGAVDLADGAVVASRHRLEIAVDGGPFVEIDLRGPAFAHRLTLDDLVTRINDALRDDVATHDGRHLELRSRHPGGGSRLQLRPTTISSRRRFVSRAYILGEAAATLFGFDRAVARGDDESRAAVTGTADLSHGVDLSTAQYLRIGVDEHAPIDIRCAGPRPRATVLGEVVERINERLRAEIEELDGENKPLVATHDGRRLSLQSPTAGPGSRIVFEVPQAQDARATLLGTAPTFARGTDARGVTLIGTTDLGAGVDLPAHAAIRIGVDTAAPVDVALTGDAGGLRSLGALASTINAALGAAIALHDGTHLALVSPSRGADARLDIQPPSSAGSVDVTAGVLGIGPRTYHGSAARRAQITGTIDLGAALELNESRYLVLAVDGAPAHVVDCANPDQPNGTTAAQVVNAINTAFQAAIASVVDNRLVLRSTGTGSAARLSIEPHTGGDARLALFGPTVPADTRGVGARPARITGTVDLLAPADLSLRSRLLLQIDGDAPREIDVAGAASAQTTLAEVVSAIDRVLPGVAAPTVDQRLEIVSPTTGSDSRVEVLPLRSLEVVEFPPESRTMPTRWLRHGDQFTLDNDGATDAVLAIRVVASQGNAGPALVDRTTNRLVALMRPLNAGDAANIWRGDDGRVRASIESPAGTDPVAVPPADIRSARLGGWASIPTPDMPWTGARPVPNDGLQLANPWAGTDDVLPRVSTLAIDVAPAQVTVTEVAGHDGDVVELTATLRTAADGWRLHGAADVELIAARAGASVVLAEHAGAVVGVRGTFRTDGPYLLVTAISRRFDVTLLDQDAAAAVPAESYPDVTIGEPASRSAFAGRIVARPSWLARVRNVQPTGLGLARGRTHWQVLECAGSRFDSAVFADADDADEAQPHAARFAGGRCLVAGIFDVSNFVIDGEPASAVFGVAPPGGPTTGWTFSWIYHAPGAFEVNLPADLPPRFGARFDQARFASDPERPELYDHVVTEPLEADDSLVKLVRARSVLVDAEAGTTVPIGFTAVTLPTRTPQFLAGGTAQQAARVYLREAGGQGFIKLEARENGPDGNLISVSSRPAGPARFDVAIRTDGGRFESARAIVAGPAPLLTERSTLEPTPLGVREARAAGTRVRVTRDRSGQ
jgi:hypothetical protein